MPRDPIPPAHRPPDERLRILRAFEAVPRPSPAPGPEAAVAVVFGCAAETEPALLLIRRATRAHDPWSGQIALPGGRRDEGDDDLVHTAIRETGEEVGIVLERRQALAMLPPIQARHRGAFVELWVVPVVFVIDGRPTPAVSDEVDAVRWIPLGDLGAEENASRIAVATAEGEREFPAVKLGSWVLWGLTHRILDASLPIGGFRLAGRSGRSQ